jgi:predicted aminopeptidase
MSPASAAPSWLFVPGAATLLILLVCGFLFSGCYTLSQGLTMLGYLHRAVPLESLLVESTDQDSSNVETRCFVERVLDIRAFAVRELGLKENDNYTRYVDIDRDYLAAVVSACAKDFFSPYQWWFPVAGSVPYKGFFDVKDARKEAEKLRKKDLDVWVRQVDAFSTLGWFSDPLYSYMRSYPVHSLAELLIHEQLHATIYVKGDSKFNEELAEFVGREGARLYIEQSFGRDSEEYRLMQDTKADSAAFVAFIQGLIAELDALYAQDLDREEKLRQKGFLIRAAQLRFDEEYAGRFRGDNYRGFSSLPVNNAYLELFRLYYSDDGYLEGLYDRCGRDLRVFLERAKDPAFRKMSNEQWKTVASG